MGVDVVVEVAAEVEVVGEVVVVVDVGEVVDVDAVAGGLVGEDVPSSPPQPVAINAMTSANERIPM